MGSCLPQGHKREIKCRLHFYDNNCYAKCLLYRCVCVYVCVCVCVCVLECMYIIIYVCINALKALFLISNFFYIFYCWVIVNKTGNPHTSKLSERDGAMLIIEPCY